MPDRLCSEAVDLARSAAVELAGEDAVGEHLGAEADGDRVVTHSFGCLMPAYRGWRWAVTVARASRSRRVTVDESVLLPDSDAVLAPEWLPWSDRLRPGDLGPGDLLPTGEDDPRLEPGWAGTDFAGDEALVDEPEVAALDESPSAEAVEEVTEAIHEARAARERAESADGEAARAATDRGAIASVARELGLTRARVLSRHGLLEAADRWGEEFGPDTPMAQAAPDQCATCGFLMPLSGPLRQAFGVCANAYSPADGRVVALTYGCGAHSEAAVMPAPPHPATPVLDETRTDPFDLRPERPAEEPAGAGAAQPEGAEPEGAQAEAGEHEAVREGGAAAERAGAAPEDDMAAAALGHA
ncbi:hypothetical protein FHU37_004725 [Allostreptomyces psammosilenae]|uniref:DUF3027 domain-containing protein n=1 Tax=Allostreptomyces psammosilenae TaxID=1892865 RepID=A0A852ZZD0_9ACTN|nr:hypothetical protein [Allostreptomyces psammosilenae]